MTAGDGSDGWRITLEADPTEADMDFFSHLRDFNVARVGESRHSPLTLFARDADGNILGGLRGVTHWGWLYVSMLVVHEDARGQGWGSRLLFEAEAEAIRRGCRHAYLDTFDYQARPFYEKHGYTLFGTLDDFPPPGHQRFFLKKTLLSPMNP
jgi:GNAT superfamily N-acetyltransferase